MAGNNSALAVDLRGLRLLVERRGKSFALLELVQNAWDEPGVTTVKIETNIIGRGRVRLCIEDDAPEGFQDLSHAYTLFASSKKKSDPEKRGRFNLGEKLVIALADIFTVETTKGGVMIDPVKNERRTLRTKRSAGSRIIADLRMTREELAEAEEKFKTLIPPAGITTEFNGWVLPHREYIAMCSATLQTEIADDAGFLRPTQRRTRVEIYEALEGEVPSLYEMGIPVVETGDLYHVNITQKVPLNADRDNVPPAFLRDVRTHVVNEMANHLTPEQASSNWVSEALEDDLIEHVAVHSILTKRFGEKRVIFDPSDPEANRIAVSQGYSLIHGNSLSSAAWKHVKEHGAALPAGRVTPSPKPFSPDGKPLETIDPKNYTRMQQCLHRAIERLHKDLVGTSIRVVLTKEIQWQPLACYGGGEIIMNIAKQSCDITSERTLATVLHEFAHSKGGHLTHAFDDAIGVYAARLIGKLIEDPMYLQIIQEG